MRVLVQPRHTLTIPIFGQEQPVRITNPTDEVLAITVDQVSITTARHPDREMDRLERAMIERNERRAAERNGQAAHQYMIALRMAGPGIVPAAANPEESARALARSKELLLSHLTPDQKRDFQTHAYFSSKGNQTEARYIIHANAAVQRAEDGHEFCLQVVGEQVPLYDEVLAKKILIESNEPLFLATANDLTAQHQQVRPDVFMDQYRRMMMDLYIDPTAQRAVTIANIGDAPVGCLPPGTVVSVEERRDRRRTFHDTIGRFFSR